MTFQPLGDRVLVQVVEAAQEKDSRIFLPDSVKNRTPEAIVIAVGDLVNEMRDGPITASSLPLCAPRISAGDRIILAELSGVEVRLDGQLFRVIPVDEILGIVR